MGGEGGGEGGEGGERKRGGWRVVGIDAVGVPFAEEAFGVGGGKRGGERRGERGKIPRDEDGARKYLVENCTGREYLEFIFVISWGEDEEEEGGGGEGGVSVEKVLKCLKEFVEGMEGKDGDGEEEEGEEKGKRKEKEEGRGAVGTGVGRGGVANIMFRYGVAAPGLWGNYEKLCEVMYERKGEGEREEEEEAGKLAPAPLPFLSDLCRHNFSIFGNVGGEELGKAIRERRSMTQYNPNEKISISQLSLLLQRVFPPSLIPSPPSPPPPSPPLPSHSVHLSLWIMGVEGLQVGRYLLWRASLSPPPSLSRSLRLEKVVHPEIPEFLPFFQILGGLEGDKDGEGEGKKEKEKELQPKSQSQPQLSPSDQKEEDLRTEAMIFSCYQDIAHNSSFTISFITSHPLLTPPSSSSSSSSPSPSPSPSSLLTYRHRHWECGYIGQQVYIQAQLLGLGCTGMGCFSDSGPPIVFGYGKGGEGREGGEGGEEGGKFVPLYHMAVGVAGERKYGSYGYEGRVKEWGRRE